MAMLDRRVIPAQGGDPFLLRMAFILAISMLFWSFVAGVIYLAAVTRGFPPLPLDPTAEARGRARRGDIQGALRQYRVFAQLNPADVHALRALGEAAAGAGRWDEAARAFEAVVRLNPRDDTARSRLAEIRELQLRPAESLAGTPLPR